MDDDPLLERAMQHFIRCENAARDLRYIREIEQERICEMWRIIYGEDIAEGQR